MFERCHHHRGSIYCLAWLGDTLLASGSNDKSICLLPLSPGPSSSSSASGGGGVRIPEPKAKKPFPLHKGTVRDIVFTSDGLMAYGGGVSRDVLVADVRTQQSVLTLTGHGDQVLCLDVLPGGLLASGGQDNTVLLWDTRREAPVSVLKTGTPVASMTSSGERLVTSHMDGSCSVYDLNGFECLQTYSAHTKECRSVRYRPGGGGEGWVLSGSYDKMVCLTNTDTLQWTKLCQHQDKVIQCRWHPRGNLFASTGTDKKACIWSIT